MHKAIGEILAWREELQARYNNPLFKVAVPTLNLGHIHGGDNPNRICGHCELHIDLRPLPGMDAGRVARGAGIHGSNAPSPAPGWIWRCFACFDGTPAMETPADAPMVQAAESLTGHPAEAVAFGTEGPYLRELDMDVVVLGPGDIEQAHQPDEYLALDRIRRHSTCCVR
jgi:acetylornithine deacetylase